jgi:hypothetical protein
MVLFNLGRTFERKEVREVLPPTNSSDPTVDIERKLGPWTFKEHEA